MRNGSESTDLSTAVLIAGTQIPVFLVTDAASCLPTEMHINYLMWFACFLLAVLMLYFISFFHWDENLSTAVYHAFSALCYFTPVIGAIMADSWLGKYK